jgi:hypothetical protein
VLWEEAFRASSHNTYNTLCAAKLHKAFFVLSENEALRASFSLNTKKKTSAAGTRKENDSQLALPQNVVLLFCKCILCIYF